MRRHSLNAATRYIHIPPKMLDLPVDRRGYIVPWFVAKVDDDWDFRAIGPGKIEEALRKNLCWLCGKRLGVYKTFVAGPMCGINRISAEPPCHKSCARYACQACPFLTQPRMVRNEKELPQDASEPGGVMIKRNPGVTMLWTAREFQIITPQRLFLMGDPYFVEWWCEGGRATREQVKESVRTGMPLLARECGESDEARDALLAAVRKFEPLMPQERAA
jgi:predicted RNA-binding Zn-ribbon protein involved in translation (DUF1610 family)